MFDLSLGTILTGFTVSTIGFSLYLYGKKQARLPQLIVGGLMMASVFIVPGAWWLAAANAALVIGLWLAVRTGR